MNKVSPKWQKVLVPYHSIRHISSPEDSENDRKIYTGQFHVTSIIDLPTDENVRGYLVEGEGKQRKVPTVVHRAIKETLINSPHNFSVLNSGIVIVAREVEIDEKLKIVTLYSPSIINGAQTQGILKELNKEKRLPNVHIKFELIVTSDDDIIADTSIARNYQNDVMQISIAGRLGILNELEDSIQKSNPDSRLRKSESQWVSNDFVDTEKLLQVITALVPTELWYKQGEGDFPNKVYTYSAKAKCLKDFQEIHKKGNDKSNSEFERYNAIYRFFIDIAPQAWELYNKWKSHQGFAKTRLHSIERDGRIIVDVPDGIIFPIIASFSVFATLTKNGWVIEPPSSFKDEELIKTAKSVYMDMAQSDPQKMGKNKACYSALFQITSIYKKLAS